MEQIGSSVTKTNTPCTPTNFLKGNVSKIGFKIPLPFILKEFAHLSLVRVKVCSHEWYSHMDFYFITA